MILSMLLAHLVGDYILQWDSLSRWKSEKLSGVLAHGSIVTVVTLLFCLPFDPNWWSWAIFIGVTHTLIDAAELPIRRRLAKQESGKSALFLFVADQTTHLAIIVLILIWSGYLALSALIDGLATTSINNRFLAFIVAYAFLTMPAWIIIKFVVHGLMNGSPPDFSRNPGQKYFCMVERTIIATLIVFGQFILIPLVTLPRLLFEWSQKNDRLASGHSLGFKRTALYTAELIASIALAVVIGLGLRQLL